MKDETSKYTNRNWEVAAVSDGPSVTVRPLIDLLDSHFRTSWPCRSGPTSPRGWELCRQAILRRSILLVATFLPFPYSTPLGVNILDYFHPIASIVHHEAILDDGDGDIIIFWSLPDRYHRCVDCGFASPTTTVFAQGPTRRDSLSAFYCHE